MAMTFAGRSERERMNEKRCNYCKLCELWLGICVSENGTWDCDCSGWSESNFRIGEKVFDIVQNVAHRINLINHSAVNEKQPSISV